MVVVCFAFNWNPAALHEARIFNEIREKDDVPFAKIFIVDVGKDLTTEADLKYVMRCVSLFAFLLFIAL